MNKFDDEFRKFDRAFNAFFAFSILVALVVLGVGIWAIIELVQWVTTK